MSLWIILFTLISSAVYAESKSIKQFFDDKTKIENPFNLRDPFKMPVSPKDQTKIEKDGYIKSGQGNYTNIEQTNLEKIDVGNLRVVGVLIGKERRALIADGPSGTNKIIILKEGMKIGQEETELKAILPGGVILVEKIVNVYGEEEYLETVVPISK